MCVYVCVCVFVSSLFLTPSPHAHMASRDPGNANALVKAQVEMRTERPEKREARARILHMIQVSSVRNACLPARPFESRQCFQ